MIDLMRMFLFEEYRGFFGFAVGFVFLIFLFVILTLVCVAAGWLVSGWAMKDYKGNQDNKSGGWE